MDLRRRSKTLRHNRPAPTILTLHKDRTDHATETHVLAPVVAGNIFVAAADPIAVGEHRRRADPLRMLGGKHSDARDTELEEHGVEPVLFQLSVEC